ncbi:High-affinity branched-chain amino acid transport system permease protein LivH [Halomicronema hongdechloris C2206]|uniref:High-affinity branched-chain amino acid transport system permease protein LivH n=1 Tax=Halomicronema hongdechloris C2206 TaxID=1641165 RepID=A0A1Z3HP84_9CYAN|nr:branched-chain amino acid ABC transporter permease [Halomicronema hongdechloris]ASC72134.1 High-affinity branched-chain amino acid transport system permease protein LivH [Halomicronema hongdechloris C2206]
MLDLLQLVIYGLVLGSILSLGAIGVSLTFGILRFANFAHGDFMAMGAYFAFTFIVLLQWPFWPSLGLACGLTVLAVLAADWLVFRHLRQRSPVILLISSFGIALIFRSLIQLGWGADQRVYRQGIQSPLQWAGLTIKPDQITIVVGALGLMVALHLFLRYTRTGKAMRAMADNVDLARVSGINTERVAMWTWVIGAVLACAAGVFLGLDTQLNPTMGWRLLLPIFASAILGGIGSPYGAIVGGLIIGLASELSTLVLSPAYKSAVAFAILVLMLIVRPTGLFGGR